MLGSFHVCAAENKREAAPGNQQLLTASTTALTRDIWEIHLLPATTLTWREKFTALDNTPPTPSSHRKSGVKIKIFFTPSSYFLHIWARYGDESEIQPFHAMIIQFKLRPKAPLVESAEGAGAPCLEHCRDLHLKMLFQDIRSTQPTGAHPGVPMNKRGVVSFSSCLLSFPQQELRGVRLTPKKPNKGSACSQFVCHRGNTGK